MPPAEAAKRFQSLIWPHRALVLRRARLLTAHAADADDLAQETLMKAFRSMENFGDDTSASAWLMTIMRNAYVDHTRSVSRRGREITIEDVTLEITESDPGPTEGALGQDLATLLERLSDQALIDTLNELPDELRWTLLLVDIEQVDYEQAAAVMDVPVGTVKSRVFRGRRILRDLLLAGRVEKAIP